MKTYTTRSLVLNLVGAVALTGMTTQAAVIYSRQQDRSVEASLDVGGMPNATNASASDFGRFTNGVSIGGGGRFEPYLVRATQDSQIGDTSITASGSVTVGLANGLVGNGNAQSDFKVKFRLLQPVSFTLGGQLVWNEILTQVIESPIVKLSGASGVIFQSGPAPMDATPLDYTTNATLLPGEYTLEAHAGATNDFCCGAEKSYTLAFDVTPTGPVGPGFGAVYQLFGALIGQTKTGDNLTLTTLAPHDLVNASLGLPAGGPAANQFLGLVSDSLDHSLRLAVWDSTTGKVKLELGTLEVEANLATTRSYVATADWSTGNLGRWVESVGGVRSRLTMSSQGGFDAAGVVNRFTGVPVVGQLNLRSASAGTTNTILIRNGTLFTGRKLGTTP